MMKLDLPPQIFTARLMLQKLRYEEAEEIFYSYASKPEATRYMSWPTHQSIEDTIAFLHYAADGWKSGSDYSYSIRLVHNHRVIGSFGIIHNDGKLQFGYILSPTQWGKGYATEACKKMMEIVRTLPGIHRVQTFTDVDNKASANVLRKCGLVEESRVSNSFQFINQGSELKDCIHFTLPLK